jgi:hypothetical protein
MIVLAGGSAGTAWLWDVALKVVPTADGGNNVAARRKQIFVMSSLCEPAENPAD